MEDLRVNKERTYTFEFKITSTLETSSLAEDLARSGCSDALLSVSKGCMFLEFDRVAFNLEEAVQTALEDAAKVELQVEQIVIDPERFS